MAAQLQAIADQLVIHLGIEHKHERDSKQQTSIVHAAICDGNPHGPHVLMLLKRCPGYSTKEAMPSLCIIVT